MSIHEVRIIVPTQYTKIPTHALSKSRDHGKRVHSISAPVLGKCEEVPHSSSPDCLVNDFHRQPSSMIHRAPHITMFFRTIEKLKECGRVIETFLVHVAFPGFRIASLVMHCPDTLMALFIAKHSRVPNRRAPILLTSQ